MNKTLLLVFVLLTTTITSFGQSFRNVTFYTENGERFWIILNGVRQNENAETNIVVTDLPAPSYKVKVIFEEEQLGEVNKTLYFAEGSADITYRIKKDRKGKYVIRFFNEVQRRMSPPQTQIVRYAPSNNYPVYPDRHATTTTTTTTTTTHNTSDQVNMNMGMGGMNVSVSANMPGGTVTHSTTTTTTGGAVHTTDHYVMDGYSGPMGCPWPMEPGDFRQAKQTIASKNFEDSKLKIAKQIINSNCLFADQVADIMHLFTFEDSRLEFAKYAYTRTFDQGNYFKVNNAFEYELTIDELNDYIEGL